MLIPTIKDCRSGALKTGIISFRHLFCFFFFMGDFRHSSQQFLVVLLGMCEVTQRYNVTVTRSSKIRNIFILKFLAQK